MAGQGSSHPHREYQLLAKTDGPLSATFWNPMRAELLKYAREKKDFLLKELYASGYPVNTEPSDDFDTYQQLISLMQGGHPAYWQSQEAQDELRKLEVKFGPAPQLQPPPMQPPMQPMGM